MEDKTSGTALPNHLLDKNACKIGRCASFPGAIGKDWKRVTAAAVSTRQGPSQLVLALLCSLQVLLLGQNQGTEARVQRCLHLGLHQEELLGCLRHHGTEGGLASLLGLWHDGLGAEAICSKPFIVLLVVANEGDLHRRVLLLLGNHHDLSCPVLAIRFSLQSHPLGESRVVHLRLGLGLGLGLSLRSGGGLGALRGLRRSGSSFLVLGQSLALQHVQAHPGIVSGLIADVVDLHRSFLLLRRGREAGDLGGVEFAIGSVHGVELHSNGQIFGHGRRMNEGRGS
mmetsp:Transcript_69570/g.153486  ORF Transcript_69570/g.153486 Transcript_69570/m.153486 type:complete len:284 (-) Transcript_69570:36-887(-)